MSPRTYKKLAGLNLRRWGNTCFRCAGAEEPRRWTRLCANACCSANKSTSWNKLSQSKLDPLETHGVLLCGLTMEETSHSVFKTLGVHMLVPELGRLIFSQSSCTSPRVSSLGRTRTQNCPRILHPSQHRGTLRPTPHHRRNGRRQRMLLCFLSNIGHVWIEILLARTLCTLSVSSFSLPQPPNPNSSIFYTTTSIMSYPSLAASTSVSGTMSR